MRLPERLGRRLRGLVGRLFPAGGLRPDRRAFTRGLALLSTAGAAALMLPSAVARAAQQAAEATGIAKRKRRRWGMAIDLDLCTGCGACVVACKTENNVPSVGPSEAAEGTGIQWMTLMPPAASEEEFGGLGLTAPSLPLPCMHCEDAPCVKVCPVGATYQSDEGITAQIWDRCIGCRYCQVACPYSRRYFNWKAPEWPESYRSFLNPSVATRPGGVVEKCTYCHHRIRDLHEEARCAGEEVSDAQHQRLTACAEACPAEAIVFGDLADEESRVSRLSRSPRSFRLLPSLGTRPKTFYLGRDRRGPTA